MSVYNTPTRFCGPRRSRLLEGPRDRATTRGRPRPERFGWPSVALVVALFLLFFGVGGGVVGGLGYAPESDAGAPLFAVVYFLACVFSVSLAVVLPTRVTVASIGLKSTSGRWLLIGAGFGVLDFLLSSAILAIDARSTSSAGPPQPWFGDALRQGVSPGFALLVFMACLPIPLAEELLFRGVLYTWLRRWGVAVAVAGSALIFGAAHGGGLLLLSTVAFGVLAALAYELSGSLWPAVAAHVVTNTSAFVADLLLAL